MRICVGVTTHLVLAVVGPDVIETRGREEWRRMTEELTAAAYGEKHLHTYSTVIKLPNHNVK